MMGPSQPFALYPDETPSQQDHLVQQGAVQNGSPENRFSLLKDWRRIAPRDDRCATVFYAAILLVDCHLLVMSPDPREH